MLTLLSRADSFMTLLNISLTDVFMPNILARRSLWKYLQSVLWIKTMGGSEWF